MRNLRDSISNYFFLRKKMTERFQSQTLVPRKVMSQSFAQLSWAIPRTLTEQFHFRNSLVYGIVKYIMLENKKVESKRLLFEFMKKKRIGILDILSRDSECKAPPIGLTPLPNRKKKEERKEDSTFKTFKKFIPSKGLEIVFGVQEYSRYLDMRRIAKFCLLLLSIGVTIYYSKYAVMTSIQECLAKLKAVETLSPYSVLLCKSQLNKSCLETYQCIYSILFSREYNSLGKTPSYYHVTMVDKIVKDMLNRENLWFSQSQQETAKKSTFLVYFTIATLFLGSLLISSSTNIPINYVVPDIPC